MSTALPSRKWQQLPEDAIRQFQADKLRHYLANVVLPFSRHYRGVFHRRHLKADAIRTLDDLRRLPFTTKDDLVKAAENAKHKKDFIIIPDQKVLAHRPSTIFKALIRGRDKVKQDFEREYRPVFMTATTGRSSTPVPFLFTRHDIANLAETGRRLFEICGASSEFRLINMFPYAPHLAFWLAHYGSTEFGVFMLSSGGGKVMGTDGNLRMIKKIKPHVLIGMPTFIYHVLQQAVDEGVRCITLRRVVLGGEKVPEGMRRKLRSLAWKLGAPDIDVIATYGFTEAKTAWAECPTHDHASTGYHLYPDMGIIEVVDPKTGEPVPEGHGGEIVFTPLDARGTVVLRYRTGDMIDGGLTYEPCPECGRTVPRLLGKISRQSEVREVRIDKIKGTLVDFNELEHILDDLDGIGAWQLELRKHNDDPLDVDELVVHAHPTKSSEEDQIKRELKKRFESKLEIHPNEIVFHDAEEMRERQGVGEHLKEKKLIDRRDEAGKDGENSKKEEKESKKGKPREAREREEALK